MKNMKKIGCFVLGINTLLYSSLLFGQTSKVEATKENMADKNYVKAKENIDAASVHDKTKDKAETWYIKGLVYASFDNDKELKQKYADYREVVLESFRKSKALNEADYMKYVLTYNGGTEPIMIVYSSYYQEGAKQYNDKNFLVAAENFKKAWVLSQEAATMPNSNRPAFDTALIVNIAVSYENGGDKKSAAEHYELLANHKIGGEVYSQIYRWLCFYYYKTAPDSVKLNKYLYVGEKLYPNDDFYGKLRLDVIRNKNTNVDKNELFEGYEKALQQDPNNVDLLKYYAGDLFNYLHPNTGKKPENAQEKNQRLVDIYGKLMELDGVKKHEYALDLGKHYYNQYLVESEEVKPINLLLNSLEEKLYNLHKGKKKDAGTMKQKKGIEDEIVVVKKNKEAVKQKYLQTIEMATTNLEMAYNHYYPLFQKGELKNFEKNVLKSNIDLLITCFAEKKDKQKEAFYDQKYSEIK